MCVLALAGTGLGLEAQLEAKPQPSRSAAAAAVDPAQRKAECDRLANTLAPDTNIENQTDNLIAALLNSMERSDPGFARMETEFPGLKDAISDRIRPVMIDNSKQTMPLYRADLSQFYCANLTSLEVRRTTAFFASSDGQAMLRAVNSSVDFKRTAGALAREDEASVADIQADKRSAGNRVTRMLTPGQYQRANAFFGSPLGRKLIALGPQRSAIDQKWFNYSPPGAEERIKQATAGAMVDHVAKTDPAGAARLRSFYEKRGVLPPR